MGKLTDKVAIITGGATGIGRGIADVFASEGCSIVIGSRDGKRLEKAAEELRLYGSEVICQTTDVTSEFDVKRLFKTVMDRFGKVDILVNNSGAFDGGPVDKITIEQWNRVMGVNVTGMFLGTREVFPIMKKQGGGRIINIGSISAQRARHSSVPYTTSKHAVWGLTQASALEGRDFGISVSCIHPGNTEVERRSGGKSSTGRDEGPEPSIGTNDIGQTALIMATLPQGSNMLEAIVLPVSQDYLGRG